MRTDGKDAREKLSSWHYSRGLATTDKLAEDWIGWTAPFDPSSTVHSSIPVHVELRYWYCQDKLLLLRNRTGD